jgi:transposase
MEAYSMDLRRRVLKDCDAGLGTLAVSVKYDVSPAWIRRLKQRRRETGETAPRGSRNKRQAKWLGYTDRLEAIVAAQPDITLKELQQKLGEDVSVQTLSRALRHLQLSFKKRSCTRQNKIVRT